MWRTILPPKPRQWSTEGHAGDVASELHSPIAIASSPGVAWGRGYHSYRHFFTAEVVRCIVTRITTPQAFGAGKTSIEQ